MGQKISELEKRGKFSLVLKFFFLDPSFILRNKSVISSAILNTFSQTHIKLSRLLLDGLDSIEQSAQTPFNVSTGQPENVKKYNSF